MGTEEALDRLAEIEAIASLLEDKAAMLKKDCHRTRAKLEGVSTLSARKGEALDARQLAQIVARRNARILKMTANSN